MSPPLQASPSRSPSPDPLASHPSLATLPIPRRSASPRKSASASGSSISPSPIPPPSQSQSRSRSRSPVKTSRANTTITSNAAARSAAAMATTTTPAPGRQTHQQFQTPLPTGAAFTTTSQPTPNRFITSTVFTPGAIGGMGAMGPMGTPVSAGGGAGAGAVRLGSGEALFTRPRPPGGSQMDGLSSGPGEEAWRIRVVVEAEREDGAGGWVAEGGGSGVGGGAGAGGEGVGGRGRGAGRGRGRSRSRGASATDVGAGVGSTTPRKKRTTTTTPTGTPRAGRGRGVGRGKGKEVMEDEEAPKTRRVRKSTTTTVPLNDEDDDGGNNNPKPAAPRPPTPRQRGSSTTRARAGRGGSTTTDGPTSRTVTTKVPLRGDSVNYDDDSDDHLGGDPFLDIGMEQDGFEKGSLTSRSVREESLVSAISSRNSEGRSRSRSGSVGVAPRLKATKRRVATPARPKGKGAAGAEDGGDGENDGVGEEEEDVPPLALKKRTPAPKAPRATKKTAAGKASASRDEQQEQNVSLPLPPSTETQSADNTPPPPVEEDYFSIKNSETSASMPPPPVPIAAKKSIARRTTRVVNVAGTTKTIAAMAGTRVSSSRTSSAASDAVRRSRGRPERGVREASGEYERESSVVGNSQEISTVDSPLLTPTLQGLPTLQVPKTRRSGAQTQQQQQTDTQQMTESLPPVQQRPRVVSNNSQQTLTPPSTSSPAPAPVQNESHSRSASGSRSPLQEMAGSRVNSLSLSPSQRGESAPPLEEDDGEVINWTGFAELGPGPASDSSVNDEGGGGDDASIIKKDKGKRIGKGKGKTPEVGAGVNYQLPTPATTQASQSTSRANIQQQRRIPSFGGNEGDIEWLPSSPVKRGLPLGDGRDDNGDEIMEENEDETVVVKKAPSQGNDEASGSVRRSNKSGGSRKIMDILPNDYACRRTLFDGVVPPRPPSPDQHADSTKLETGKEKRRPRKSVGFSSSPPTMFAAPQTSSLPPPPSNPTAEPHTPEKKARFSGSFKGEEFADLFAPKIKYRELEKRAIQERPTPDLLRVRMASVVLQRSIFGGPPGDAEKEAVRGEFGGMLRTGGPLGQETAVEEKGKGKGKGKERAEGDDERVNNGEEASNATASKTSAGVSYPRLPTLSPVRKIVPSYGITPSAPSSSTSARPIARLLQSGPKQTPIKEKDLRASLLETLTRTRRLVGVRKSVTPEPSGNAATSPAEMPQASQTITTAIPTELSTSLFGRPAQSSTVEPTLSSLRVDEKMVEDDGEDTDISALLQAQFEQQQREHIQREEEREKRLIEEMAEQTQTQHEQSDDDDEEEEEEESIVSSQVDESLSVRSEGTTYTTHSTPSGTRTRSDMSVTSTVIHHTPRRQESESGEIMGDFTTNWEQRWEEERRENIRKAEMVGAIVIDDSSMDTQTPSSSSSQRLSATPRCRQEKGKETENRGDESMEGETTIFRKELDERRTKEELIMSTPAPPPSSVRSLRRGFPFVRATAASSVAGSSRKRRPSPPSSPPPNPRYQSPSFMEDTTLASPQFNVSTMELDNTPSPITFAAPARVIPDESTRPYTELDTRFFNHFPPPRDYTTRATSLSPGPTTYMGSSRTEDMGMLMSATDVGVQTVRTEMRDQSTMTSLIGRRTTRGSKVRMRDYEENEEEDEETEEGEERVEDEQDYSSSDESFDEWLPTGLAGLGPAPPEGHTREHASWDPEDTQEETDTTYPPHSEYTSSSSRSPSPEPPAPTLATRLATTLRTAFESALESAKPFSTNWTLMHWRLLQYLMHSTIPSEHTPALYARRYRVFKLNKNREIRLLNNLHNRPHQQLEYPMHTFRLFGFDLFDYPAFEPIDPDDDGSGIVRKGWRNDKVFDLDARERRVLEKFMEIARREWDEKWAEPEVRKRVICWGLARERRRLRRLARRRGVDETVLVKEGLAREGV